MAPPATRTRADKPAAAPAPARPVARTPATRSAVPSRLAGKPAVRLSIGTAPRRKSVGAPAAAEADAAPKEPPDPRLEKAIGKVRRNASKLKKHDPAKDKAEQAQDAAEPPEKEVLSRAQANKVGEIKSEMDAARKPSVDEKPPQEKSFLETLEEEIERVMPKKVEDTDHFMGAEDRKNLKDSMSGNIEAQKQQVTGPVKTAAGAKPDESVVTPKPVVTPLPEALPKAAPEPVGARDAMPAPLPDEKVSLQSSKDEAQRQFDENKITPVQLQKANDPRFTAVLKAKEDVDAHADSAPQQYRETEQKTLTTAVSRAVAAERRDMSAMLGTHGRKGGDVAGHQTQAMKDDKARRQEVVDFIEKKFTTTKEAVEKKLATLETDVTTMFDEGIEKNIKSMKDEATRKKDDWKEDRYYWHGVMTRPDLWLKDKLMGIDEHPRIKRIYVEAAEQFTRDMKTLVREIARVVESRLKEAKDEVEKGRKEIHDYVEKLDGKLKQVGLDAEKAVAERFDELVQSIEDKKRDLASNLAQRYKDAHDKAGEAIKEMQAEDKGLVSALIDKLKEIVEILSNFRRRVMAMLRKAASAIDLIVADPIGFLKNLLNAIKRGISQFVDRIWTHLKEGFMAWLFGSLATMGVAIPKDLSLPSILQLVLDVLGITYSKIRGKVVKLIGERNVALLEAAWKAVDTLLKGGPAALWEQIKGYFSNLKEMVVDAIQDWLITRIIQSAATKIAMMFNPAGAIIQAILTIYRTVMFFIENIDRILAFVESIIESVYNIATGAIGSAADWIEKALARTIPIIIGFLARLLGISGLADKIREFIHKIQTRIDKAIDKVIDKVVGGIKSLFKKSDKPKQQAAAADKPSEKLDIAMKGLKESVAEMEHQGASAAEIEAALPGLREKYGFKSLTMKQEEDDLVFDGEVNPRAAPVRAPRPGSKQLPFFLTWYKPRYYEYPTLYFGGVIDKPKSQSALKAIHSKGQNDETGLPVVEYKPDKMTTLPDRKGALNGPTLGIDSQFRIVQHAIIGPLKKAQTPGGGKFNGRMDKYGWVAGNEGMDADHVQEIQLGGKDHINNLWPLDATLNSNAGNAMKNATVTYQTSGKPIRLSDLKDFTSRKYYFKITKFETP